MLYLTCTTISSLDLAHYGVSRAKDWVSVGCGTSDFNTYITMNMFNFGCWLVGCFGFNGPLRQYFSLYRAVFQREGERGEKIDESKNIQTTPTRNYCKRNRPLPYCNQTCRTPRHWKFTKYHRTTRPPPWLLVLADGMEQTKSHGNV